MRGRSRKGPNPLSRTYESNGPDVKIRGTASHIADKYVTLARDAQSSGDPVAAENYFQHAEHYYRILAAAQPQFQPQQGFSRADDDDDLEDGEFEGDGAAGFNGMPEPHFAGQPRPEGGGNQQRYDNRPRYDDQAGREQGGREQSHGQQGQPRYPRSEDQREGGQREGGQRPRYDDNRRPDDRRQPYDNRGGNNYRGDGNRNDYRGGDQRPRHDDRRPNGDRGPQGDRAQYADRQQGGRDAPRPAEIRAEQARAEQPRPDQSRSDQSRAEAPRSYDQEPDPGLPAFITGPSPIVAVNGNGSDHGSDHERAPEEAEPAPRAPARRRRAYKARAAEAADSTEAAAGASEAAASSGPAEE
jgi:hypothetical protein